MGMRMPGPNVSQGQQPQGPQGGGPGVPGALMVRGGMMAMQRNMNPQMQGGAQDMEQQLKQFEVSFHICLFWCFLQPSFSNL